MPEIKRFIVQCLRCNSIIESVDLYNKVFCKCKNICITGGVSEERTITLTSYGFKDLSK